jgi:fatty-acyl-CoA synthase
MNIMTLLQMAAEADGERIAVGTLKDGLTLARVFDTAGRLAAWIERSGIERVVWSDVAGPLLPVALYGSAWAGTPFVPVNYRLADDRLRALIAQQKPAVVFCEPGTEARFEGLEGITVVPTNTLEATLADVERAPEEWPDDERVALLLYTSGTSGDPKAAILRHDHLASYVLGSIEFLGADPGEATLVTVPPYHIAGVAAILTATFSGRRLVQLANFEPEQWARIASDEGVTHAMVVPTMLARINAVLPTGPDLSTLRHLSYGGGRMPLPVIEETMKLLPHVGFVNAYGLTETSSSVAILGPDDHRAAMGSDDPAIRARLGSVGQPLPTVEITIRDADGNEVGPGEPGEVWVRGDQVSGEYSNKNMRADEGWFPTSDGGYLDADGYLYVTGRLDDVIVRGGENLSPGEIEDVMLQHPSVSEVCVLGLPDDEWGEVVAAVVVAKEDTHPTAEDLADFVVKHLRSSRRPHTVVFRDELPTTDTGKVLRRVLRTELSD